MILALTVLMLAQAAPPSGVAVAVESQDGSQVRGTLQLASVKIKGDLGEVEIEIAKIVSIQFRPEMDSITTQGNSVVRGKITTAEFKVVTSALGTLTLPREKLKEIRFDPGPALPAAPARPPDDKPKKVTPAENELQPLGAVKLNSSVPDLYLSKDRAWLYVLNGSEGKVQRLDTAQRTLDAAAADVTEGTEGMCLTPDGKTIYTYASPGGHSPYRKDEKGAGKVQVIDAATLKVRSTFAIDFDPCDIEANDQGFVYLSGGSSQWTAICAVDTNRKSVVARWGQVYQGSVLKMTPDQKRLYFGTNGLSPGNFHCLPIPANLKDHAAPYNSPYHGGDNLLGGRFEISPDGAYLVAGYGSVLRLAKNQPDDLKHVTKIEPHQACVFDKEGGRLMVSTLEGALKVYSFPGFELKTTYILQGAASRMAFDPKSGSLYAFVEPARRERTPVPPPSGPGDLHVYAIPPAGK